jgi:hypothetical protein
MELTINIEYDQVLKLARQLPYKYKRKLTREIEKDLKAENEEKTDGNTKYQSGSEDLNELQQFLLQGPLMSDEQFDGFKKLRKDFNRWLEK